MIHICEIVFRRSCLCMGVALRRSSTRLSLAFPCACTMYIHVYDNSNSETLRKTKQHNTTKLTQGSHFQRNNELSRAGFEPTTFCVLDRCSYPLSYRGSSAGWDKSHVHVQLKAKHVHVHVQRVKRPDFPMYYVSFI